MQIAISQFAAGQDVDANLRQIGASAADAAAAGARVVVFPEGAMFGALSSADELAAAAQPLDGPFVRALQEVARRHDLVLVAGMFETGSGVRPHNTVVVVGAEGLIGLRRKAFVYDAFGYRESDAVEPAPSRADVFEVDGFTLGVLICYEVRFPECSRALVDAGADVLVVCSAWPVGPAKEDHWTTMVKARAIENTVYVAAAGDCGPGLVGRSHVVDPLGYVVAGLGNEPGTATTAVDHDRLASARRTLPLLAQRRGAVLA